MPSPFPGMDPYLEHPELWPDVHHALIAGVQQHLNALLRPLNYVARVELRTFMFEPDDPATELYLIPDTRIVERGGRVSDRHGEIGDDSGGGEIAVVAVPVATPIDLTDLEATATPQRYLEIRDAADRRVVTVIEVLSPSNKVNGSAGRRAFFAKREEVRSTDANWFEIDLLRAGTPSFNHPSVPKTAYRAYADRSTEMERRRLAWPIRLRERLPVLPIPLRPGEADVPLDLQSVLDAAYDRAAYGADTDYAIEPDPPLPAHDAAWADEVLRAAKLRG